MKRGKFIVIYGANNLGKTTQAKLLVKRLKKTGKKIKYLKYPIYNLEPTGSILNKFLRKGLRLTEYEAQYIFVHNRKDFEPKLMDYLNKGYWVVAEDYKGTGICWGATHDVPLKKMLRLNSGLLEEDVGIILDGNQIKSAIEKKHHNEDGKVWEKGRQIHLKVAKLFKWRVVNANQTIEKVSNDIWRVIQNKYFRNRRLKN